jgi:membrane protease YdiL (CAAX protease family)
VSTGRRVGWGALCTWFVLHTVVWIGLVRFLPGDDFVEYPELGSAGLAWVRQFVVALLVVLGLQVVVLTTTGWWRTVWVDDRPLRARWWVALVALAVPAASFLSAGAPSRPADAWIGLTVTMLLVGLTEELTFRGIVLVGARARTGERRALLFSSLLFGLFHLPNALLGAAPADAARQVLATALIGTLFYVFRRVSRGLLVPVLLHAAWDWLLISTAY